MKILILGGTEFLGRHFVDIALSKGHEITLFNRGKTNPNLFPAVETIIGDRNTDLDKIKGRIFDAVVDTSGYFPENLEYVTKELKSHVGQYLFVSSCSVYDYNDQTLKSFTESNGTLVNLDIDKADKTPETYGARKYHCEQVVKAGFPDNHFIVRPGLIVGPYDPTYRFPYWADRVSEGGEILAPGSPEAPLQYIDARDLAQWMLMGVENKLTGVFNTDSPHGELTIGETLETIKSTINPDCTYKWVSEQFLKDNDVSCWSELPLWIYEEIQGFLKVDSTKAIAKGLKFRALKETVKDTYKWSKSIYKDEFISKTLSRDKEQKLLKEYEKL